MPLPSCSAFDVSTRKVPSLALVPRGHLKHAIRAKKKVAGSIQQVSQSKNQLKQRAENVLHSEHVDGNNFLSPPPPATRQQLSDETATEVAAQQETPPDENEIKEGEGGEDNYAGQAELRLGERFLNVMALMARLSTQSLGNNPTTTSSGSPNRLVRTNAERKVTLARTNTEKSILHSSAERVLSPVAAALSPLQVQSPSKSPKHAVREVAKRLPRTLQGPLTFDICMLLPIPLDERQSPLKSPIRRKRLRKRLRRRRLRRRARRTWQASHASWPAHASADYIEDHSRQDIAGISATRLVERLGGRMVNSQTLPRVTSMPLPPLHRNNKHNTVVKPIDEGVVESVDDSDNDQQEREDENSQDEDEDEEQGEEDDDNSSSQSDESPLLTDNTTTIASSSSQAMQEHDVDRTAVQPKKRPLYHQPAWISPELHIWLVESRLFSTKPRHELL